MAKVVSVKVQLGEALRNQLRTKPLHKITVSGLCQQVGITRQAFYYHFADVYDLALWVFKRDIANHIMAHATYADWARGFEELLAYMRTNRLQTYQALKSLSHEDLEKFFYHQFQAMMQAIVEELKGDLRLAEDAEHFVVDHFTLIVLGYTIHWLATDMRDDPAILVPRIKLILRGQVDQALRSFASPRHA